MELYGQAQRLTIMVGESDMWQHTPLYHEIVARAHGAGLAGASVFRGVESYGARNHIHTTRILSLSEDLPLAIVIIDTAQRIEAFLPQITELLAGGLVVIEDVRVVQYGAGASAPGAGTHSREIGQA